MTRDLVVQFLAQGAQMTFVLLIAPLAVGVVRRVKARLMRRQGPPLLQAYLDLAKLLRKESVIADSASWLFRSAPYLIFALTWVAAALVPSFASGLMFNWAADVVALVALLGAARALLALAGMDVGTSFGGIGSSREMMIATLGRARHDADRADAGHRRRHDTAGRRRRLLHRRAVWRARVARAVARSRWSSWRWPRMRASRSTTRRRIWSSPWSTRPWCWNIPDGTWP